jgi:glutamine synthetase
MKDSKDQVKAFLGAHPDIEVFEAILPDLACGLRGKWVTRDKLRKVIKGGLKLPLSTLAFDVWGRDVEALVFDSGDGDGICVPDLRTLTPVPWASRPTGQVVVSLHEVGGKPCDYDSRVIVQRLIDRLAGHGLTPVVASEMEFHLLLEDDDDLGRPRHSQEDRLGGLVSGGQTYGLDLMADQAELMHAIRDACEAQALPVDTLIKEAGPSQYEINLYHNPDALVAADQAMLLQRTIRSVAANHGYRATFMAKPFGDQIGNGMHVHCSLLDAEGNNAFSNGGPEGNELLRQAIAGCLESMADCMLLFAPNLNSYRRFQRGSHAPLAPSWGYENRTVSVRVPTDVPAGTRIEHRVAGADASPYLVIAAILAGMIHGIENRLQAPPPLEGNAYDQLPPTLPRYWQSALEQFEHSSFIASYLGEEFRRVYTLAKQQELDEFDRHVTPLEYDACL